MAVLQPSTAPLIETTEEHCHHFMAPTSTRCSLHCFIRRMKPSTSALKTATVKPILKKPCVDPEVLASDRPISNLPFLSKLLEKAVQVHLKHNNLFETFSLVFCSHPYRHLPTSLTFWRSNVRPSSFYHINAWVMVKTCLLRSQWPLTSPARGM